MNARRCFSILFGLALTALVVAACSPAATFPAPTSAPPPTFTQAPQPTQAAPTSPAPSPTPAPTQIGPTPTAIVEGRVVELEWPPQMRLGDSDVVRLSLIPSKDGYTVTTEFPEHTAVTSTVSVARPGGYDLSAVGRLEGVGFTISPTSEQVYSLPPGETVAWRWTLTPDAPGQHRLAVSLVFRWTPLPGTSGFIHDSQVYSKGLDVRVTSFLGLTKGQAIATGFIGLIFGGGLSLMALTYRVRLPRPALQILSPNTALAIEPHPNIELHAHERSLLHTLFRRYGRVIVESEFRSGYSGARTLLALPIRADGRADADATVLLFPSSPQAWANAGPLRRFRAVRATKTGAFTTSGLPPGSYYAVAVAADAVGEWTDPRTLEALAKVATEVRLDEGDKKTQDLRTKEVR